MYREDCQSMTILFCPYTNLLMVYPLPHTLKAYSNLDNDIKNGTFNKLVYKLLPPLQAVHIGF